MDQRALEAASQLTDLKPPSYLLLYCKQQHGQSPTCKNRVLSRETQSKAAQVLLAPTICCHRNPLGGRNFESFSEDPVLSGTLAVGYISGVQESEQVVATVKHL